MGMASSQVRLLMITNRIHDIEYKAQCLQNAKILLAMLEDDAYQDYVAALDGSNSIAIGGDVENGITLHDLVNELGVGITDSEGNIYVSDTFKNAFDATMKNGGDYGTFAWYMKHGTGGELPTKPTDNPNFQDMALKSEPQNDLRYGSYEAAYTNNGGASSITQEEYDQLTEEDKLALNNYQAELAQYNKDVSDGKKDVSAPTEPEPKASGYKLCFKFTEKTDVEAPGNPKGDAYILKFNGALTNNISMDRPQVKPSSSLFVEVENGQPKIYTRRTDETQKQEWNNFTSNPTKTRIKTDDFTLHQDSAVNSSDSLQTLINSWSTWGELQDLKNDSVYLELFNQCKNAKGEVRTNNFSANELGNMISSGGGGYKLTKKNASGRGYSYNDDGTISENPFSYSVNVKQDQNAIAAASAEYEHRCKQIDNKEKQYDTELAKLETERTALTTELEGLKKVINDNIERTFGIFS